MIGHDAPLVVVYLGDTPPGYMRAALTLAQRHANVPVRVLAPASFSAAVPPGCSHVHLESFYVGETAMSALRGLQPWSRRHLDLWTRSTERFVVLHRYAEWAGLESFFHTELDCVPFRLDVLGATLSATGLRGMFVPLDDPGRAVASLVVVDDRAVLAELVDWAAGQRYRSDMELLARFALARPDSVIGLPTLEVLQAPERFAAAGLSVIDPRVAGCLVDAASLGQWVAGIDPMNLRLRTLHRNHFVNEHVPDPSALASSRFEWDACIPVVTGPDGRSLRLHGLHLHSKIHPHLLRPHALARLIDRADGERARLMPGATGHAFRRGPAIIRAVARGGASRAIIAVAGVEAIRRTGVVGAVVRPSLLRRFAPLRMEHERAQPMDPLAATPPGSLPVVTVLIPCAAKDVDALSLTIESIASGVVNPLDRVVLVAPAHVHDDLAGVVAAGVELEADDRHRLPRTSAAIAEVVPSDRQGWVTQQVVKLAFVAASLGEGVLVLDADTVLLQPRVWLSNGRQILPVAHEYHRPYVRHMTRVLGPAVRDEGVSWVTHHQLMQPRVVRDLLRAVLRRHDGGGAPVASERDSEFDVDRALEIWVRSADFAEVSALSEYHTYGAFLRSTEPELAVVARWANVTVSRAGLEVGLAALRRSHPDALSVSGHSHITLG